MSRSSAANPTYGQVIEYIEDRLYLAFYSHTPNADTPFPYGSKKSNGLEFRSPRKNGLKEPSPVYFTLDRSFRYNAFHDDFGPLHIGHLYRFAILLHEILAVPGNEERPVIFWSKPDSRSRANAACVLACYMVLIQSWPPHLALAPLSQMDPPCMPFRDAGYSQADYGLTIQDVVYGVWRAKEEGLCGLMDFSLEEYETFERVDMGDFNWVTPFFVAFASPQHEPIDPVPSSSPHYSNIPGTVAEVERDMELPSAFRNVLVHFATRNVGLVVRLNSELYSPTYFTKLGIQHLDMIFPDGTCPSLATVRKFINLAHEVITVRKRYIAVHCKAGLGRTGCLIGAYLIYRFGFSASELIGFMRFQRPGMVVGPQQHWLHLNQGIFRQWWFEDTILKESLAKANASLELSIAASNSSHIAEPSTPMRSPRRSNGQVPNGCETPTPRSNKINGEQKQSQPHSAAVPSSNPPDCGVLNENLPAPTPGQPRKNRTYYGNNVSPSRSPHRSPLRDSRAQADPFLDGPTQSDSETEAVSARYSHYSEQNEKDEAAMSRIRQQKRAAPRSPLRTVKETSSPVHHSAGDDGKPLKAVAYSSSMVNSGTAGHEGSGSITVSKTSSSVVASAVESINGMDTRGRKVSGGSGAVNVAKTRYARMPGSVVGATPNGVRKSSGRVRSSGSTAAWQAGRK